MSLQIKFSLLLAALGSAVLIALASAWWALDVTYREIRGPVESSSNVVNLLIGIERHIDQLRALAEPSDAFRTAPASNGSPSSDGTPSSNGSPSSVGSPILDVQAYRDHTAPILEAIQQINADDHWRAYAGTNATKTMQEKFWLLRLKFAAAFSAPELAPRDQAPEGMQEHAAGDASMAAISNQLFQIHELLKLMERRVIEDIHRLAISGTDLRDRMMIVLGLALLLVVLTAGLALLLIRRWILNPVSNLRTAAARIASGDFDHRVPIPATSRRDEIIALSAEVNHMAGMVKRLQAARIEQERLAALGEMIRRLAHNLREPLAGIRGLAELTRSEVAPLGAAADDVRETQSRIITAVDRYHRWLADLLSFSNPTHIHPTPTPTAAWLTGLVEAHRPLALTRGVDLTVEQDAAPPSVQVDPRHLEHAVSAILSNAIEASARPQGQSHPKAVRILSRAVQSGQDEPVWELRIEDTGPGVPPELRQRIFKPYFTTKPHGSGIGLAVAQQVIIAHGGAIAIEDASARPAESPDEPRTPGAAFVIRLPVLGRPEADNGVARIGQ